MRTALFWAFTQRVLVIPYRRFGTTYLTTVHLGACQRTDFFDCFKYNRIFFISDWYKRDLNSWFRSWCGTSCTKIDRNIFLIFRDGTCNQASWSFRLCALEVNIQLGESRRLVDCYTCLPTFWRSHIHLFTLMWVERGFSEAFVTAYLTTVCPNRQTNQNFLQHGFIPYNERK
jgi:hypothetical protein